MRMKRKRAVRKKPRFIDLHMYGIFDTKKNTIIKVSLDPTEIQMEIALSGGLNDNLVECEFNIKLAL
jgi:hypothetical protein